MMKRLQRWWTMAEAGCARLSRPPIDVVARDADVAELWHESWIGSTVSTLTGRVQAEWMASRCRRWLRQALASSSVRSGQEQRL